jgi:glycosyltransferase involved in cell wall biosynthesis
VKPLRILHVMRAPVGGLFRHVVDLAGAQAERGHAVGIVADASTGAERAEAVLRDLAPRMGLGISRIAMSRHIGVSDLLARKAISALARDADADVLHGHGAKGGAYARLAALSRKGVVRAYTPHGGSLHYSRSSPLGLFYLTLERVLTRRTDLFLFESAYGRDAFKARVGDPGSRARVVHNGVKEDEFAPIVPEADAADLVFVGELRMLKGVDVLLDALALLKARGHELSATIIGDGPDAQAFENKVKELALRAVRFAGAMPARAGFAKGRTLVVPSRAESLPYIVLEAAAARMPMIATSVGGIPEIFGPDAAALIVPGNAQALADMLESALTEPMLTRQLGHRLQARVHAGFSVAAMTDAVLAAYGEAMERERP